MGTDTKTGVTRFSTRKISHPQNFVDTNRYVYEQLSLPMLFLRIVMIKAFFMSNSVRGVNFGTMKIKLVLNFSIVVRRRKLGSNKKA